MAARHRRRYLQNELSQKLQSAGFFIEQATYFMASIVPLLRIRRLGNRLRGQQPTSVVEDAEVVRDELRVSPLGNRVIVLILLLEARILACTQTLPWRASLLVAARKEPVPVA